MERKTIRTFEDLIVWQKAIEFVKEVYLITSQGDLKRDFGLRDQMRRAAVSIPTNIAEGFERASRKEYLLICPFTLYPFPHHSRVQRETNTSRERGPSRRRR